VHTTTTLASAAASAAHCAAGQGKWSHPAGDSYEGEWEEDKRHGFGTYRMASGRSWTGIWRHGKQFQQTDTYGDVKGGVVYQSTPASGPGRVPNPAPAWKGQPPGAGSHYDVVVNRAAGEGAYDVVAQKQPEGTYDVVVNKAAAAEGAYDVVARKDATYDVVAPKKK
jgi:hypothetical protein